MAKVSWFFSLAIGELSACFLVSAKERTCCLVRTVENSGDVCNPFRGFGNWRGTELELFAERIERDRDLLLAVVESTDRVSLDCCMQAGETLLAVDVWVLSYIGRVVVDGAARRPFEILRPLCGLFRDTMETDREWKTFGLLCLTVCKCECGFHSWAA